MSGGSPAGAGPLGVLIIAALLVWPFWCICEKAGYPGISDLELEAADKSVHDRIGLLKSGWTPVLSATMRAIPRVPKGFKGPPAEYCHV